MFQVNDSNGDKLYIKDKILHTYDEGPDTVSMIGIVITFPNEGEVQYQPVKYKDGEDIKDALPKICRGEEVTQIDSLASRALALKKDDDWKELIIEAEERYLDAVERNKKKKAGSRGGRTAKPKVEVKVLNSGGF